MVHAGSHLYGLAVGVDRSFTSREWQRQAVGNAARRTLGVASGAPGATVSCLMVRGGAQPQRHRRWFHGLVDHGQELGRERVQVDLFPEPSAERLDGLGRVVAAAVEAPVDRLLNAATGGPE